MQTKILPYVYKLTHPVTGEFYIGFRKANLVQAEDDLSKLYFTSSKIIKPRFFEFQREIIAEFFDAIDAYKYEQQLIYESWDLPGRLNRICHHLKKNFGVGGISLTEEHKAKISCSLKGTPKTEEHNIKVSNAKTGVKFTDEHKQALSSSHLGNTHTEETKAKMRARRHTEETREKMKESHSGHEVLDTTKQKISDALKGKKKAKFICRIYDKKEMDAGNWSKYLKRLSLISLEDT